MMLNGFPDNFRMGDDDVLNEFRQKQANFDLEEKRNEINNSRSLFIGALAGLGNGGRGRLVRAGRRSTKAAKKRKCR